MLLITVFLTVWSVLNVDGATLRRVAPEQNRGPATQRFVNSLSRRTQAYQKPDYFRIYRRAFGKTCQLCGWMEKKGIPPETGAKCLGRKNLPTYTCFRGGPEPANCEEMDPRLVKAKLHPTIKCTCGADKLFECVTWDPCLSPPTAAPMQTIQNDLPISSQPSINCATCPIGYNDGCNTCTCDADGKVACTELACFTSGKPFCLEQKPADTTRFDCKTCPNGYFDGCNHCSCGPTGLAICSLRACIQGQEQDPFCQDGPVEEPAEEPVEGPAEEPEQQPLECPVDGPLVFTEEKNDDICKGLSYACIAPLVKWKTKGCGCGCQPPQGAVVAQTCPEKKPKLMGLCDLGPDEKCLYGEECSCGQMVGKTSCVCENGRFVCGSSLELCPVCPAGEKCSATQKCGSGQQCVDDTSDACNPNTGDQDCDGVCVPDTCPTEDDGHTYVETDYDICDDSKPYQCADDEVRWKQEGCGCGCKKKLEVSPAGITECPASISDAKASDVFCAVEMTCEWGEESCCGESYPSMKCSCSAGGGFVGCFHTDKCFVPDCSQNCPSELPTTGKRCDSKQFAGFMSTHPLSFGTKGYCGYGSLDCTCDGSISLGFPEDEHECRCVDDKWECSQNQCESDCPASTGPAIGQMGGFCGGMEGILCDAGLTCVDDPTDTCSPLGGGVDCGGICLAATCPVGREAIYMGTVDTCKTLQFTCDPGFEYWSKDGCGCGCKPEEVSLLPPPEDPVLGEACPATTQGTCDPSLNNKICEYGVKLCPEKCGSTVLVDSGSDHFCECEDTGNWVCRATSCGTCREACPLERPSEGDECSVLDPCTYGTACGCGDDEFESFNCVDNKFVKVHNLIACLRACPEDQPDFPADIDGAPCTESGGFGTECICECGQPCGSKYECNCNADGKYECELVHSPFIRPLCLACEEIPAGNPDGSCPETAPNPGESCDIPNTRCGYDEVCGVNTKTYDCLYLGAEPQWQLPRTWATPDCSTDQSVALPVLDLNPIEDQPETIPLLPVQDVPELGPIIPLDDPSGIPELPSVLEPPEFGSIPPPIGFDPVTTGGGSDLDNIGIGLTPIQDTPVTQPMQPAQDEPSAPKNSWPEFLGKPCDPDALSVIQAAPNVRDASCVPDDALVTFDFKSDRVRIRYDADPSSPNFGNVTSPPQIG